MEPSRVFDRPGVTKVARWGIVIWTLIGGAILGYLVLHYLLVPVKVLFPILVVSTILVYILNPLVTRLEGRGIRRGWGAAVLYFGFLALLAVAVAFLAPIVVAQVKQLAISLPDLGRRSAEWLHTALDRLGLDIAFTDLLREIQEGQSFAGGFVARATSVAGGLLEIGLILVVGPILGFYLLVDFPKIKAGIRAAIPPRKQEEWKPVGDRITTAIGGFFRGQLLVAVFVGLASMFVLWVVGLPFWALVGILAGVFNIVPMIGPYVAAVIAVLVSLTAQYPSGTHLLDLQPGPGMALASVVGLIIVQQVDNHIVSPNVVARTVKLHPVTVMMSLFIFGIFFGFWGLLLAVPTVATVKILLLHYWDTRVTWPPEPAEVVASSGRGQAVGLVVGADYAVGEPSEPTPDAKGDQRFAKMIRKFLDRVRVRKT